MGDAIRVAGLGKAYPGFALDNVSFTLPAGYMMGFVGRNGAGQDDHHQVPAAHARAGLRPDRGTRTGGERRRCHQAGHRGGVRPTLLSRELDGRPGRTGPRAVLQRLGRRLFLGYVNRFGLPSGKRVRELSHGMGMKLMLAAALSHHARLLILDEPTSGLDPVARDDLLDVLAEYIADGTRSVLFSTHITADLERIADYITLIDAGRIVYTGAKDDLTEAYRLIHGGPDELTGEARQRAIGLRQTELGFSALVRPADVAVLPPGIRSDTPSIDEVLVHIAKQGDADDRRTERHPA